MKLKFKESFLYEKPKGHFFRGISVKMNGVILLNITYDEDRYPITKKEKQDVNFWVENDRKTLTIQFPHNIPQSLYTKKGEIKLYKQRRFLLSDINNVKKECEDIIKRYRTFLKNGEL